MARDPPKGVPPDDERYLMTLRIPKKSTVQVFRMFSLLESCLVVNPDNFFIAKSDLNLKCVESERVKNMKI